MPPFTLHGFLEAFTQLAARYLWPTVALWLIAALVVVVLFHRLRQADKRRALQADIEAEKRAADLYGRRPVIVHRAVTRGKDSAA